MKTPKARTPAPDTRQHVQTRGASGRTPANDALTGLQQRADTSPATRAAQTVQRRADGVVQREVDDSPILPGHDNYKDGTLDWDESKGVPDWAKQQYIAEAKTTLICSMKDGKIGSIYFPTGRIRTTHGSGPEHKPDKTDRTSQRYNLHLATAQHIFDTQNTDLFPNLYWKTDVKLSKKKREKLAKRAYDRAFKLWLSTALLATPDNALPNWIERVTGADTAHDPSTGAPADGMKLFEVFKRVSNGQVASWHPSRGVAAKFETNKQVVSVLQAAIKQIDGVTDVNERNTKFYEFILHRVPDFAAQIRRPDQL